MDAISAKGVLLLITVFTVGAWGESSTTEFTETTEDGRSSEVTSNQWGVISRRHRGQSIVSCCFLEWNGGLTTEDGGRHGDLKFGGLSWPMSVVCRLSFVVWRGGGGRRTDDRGSAGRREGVLPANLREWARMKRGEAVFVDRFHRFPQIGKRGVLRILKESGTGILLRTICANLCNLWITHSSFSSIREQKGSVNSIELFSRAERMTEFRSNQ